MELINISYLKKNFLFFGVLYLYQVSTTDAINYNYSDPSTWYIEFPTCGGQRQSPIDIDTSLIQDWDGPNQLEMHNFENVPKSTKLIHNDHTIMVEFEWDSEIPYFTGGPFNGEYQFDSLHFHWSDDSDDGSEHSVDGKKAAVELHKFFHKTEYGSFTEASNHSDGLIVTSGLFWLEPEDKKFAVKSPVLTEIIDNLDSVREVDSNIELEPFSITEFRSVNTDYFEYIAYNGSRTTPPCQENSVRMISSYEFYITKDQLTKLQNTIKFEDHEESNARPIQPLDGRPLYRLMVDIN